MSSRLSALFLALGLSLQGCASPKVAMGKVTRGCELDVRDARVPGLRWSHGDVLEVTFDGNTLELADLATFGRVEFCSVVDGERRLLDLVPKGSEDEIEGAVIGWKGNTITFGDRETLSFSEGKSERRVLRWTGRTWVAR
jgi:hypothetical protein